MNIEAESRISSSGNELSADARGVEYENVDLSIRLGNITLQNPVMPASGCYGHEINHLVQVPPPGALVTKTIFASVRSGNPAPRLAETEFGMLNSVGIPSPGAEVFFSDVLPRYELHGSPVFVSIGGLSVDGFLDMADACANKLLFAVEINVSCPNLEKGGSAIGADPDLVYAITRGVKERVSCPVSVKLTPSVTSISEGVVAAQEGGADMLVVANSFSGMAIDIGRRRAKLGKVTGGYTGPAIKPMSLKMVYEAAKVATVPIIGCGGISSAEDVAEFLIAGANAVQVGTATFSRADALSTIVDDLPRVCRELSTHRISDLVGTFDANDVSAVS